MTNTEMQQIAGQHGFSTEERDGSLFLLVPWSQRLHDGSFATGVDSERIYDLRSLRTALGY